MSIHEKNIPYEEGSGNVFADPDDYVSLYHLAFEKYGSQALWNVRHFEEPTPNQALTITQALRTHGGMDGRRLAEQIEQQCYSHPRHQRDV